MDRLAILAPGLLGASVAQAARERGVARRVTIWARRADTRRELAGQSWCDDTADTPEAATKGANLVVIAAPVDQIVPLAERIAPSLGDGAIVTDVGSVKTAIARQGGDRVREGSGGRAYLIGAHPMAGSEKTGWQHAVPTLFENQTCFVTPTEATGAGAVRATEAFWAALGAKVVRVTPELHDQIVAHISHLPQLAASTLCSFLGKTHPVWGAYAGGGLRDTTRIAGSDPGLWQTIFSANQPAVLAALRGWQQELAAVEKALAAGDFAAIATVMTRGKTFRDKLRS